ncbi:hypothetical protein NYR55_10745 [Sphingomonas sp. BGYR3]|uniref:hypothetical protein n=1 Tax=Sphingomonas sp. BGYR3 TaxID=2975483 RepID=UPI0021A6871C|nr:hypothetical protein [Sphingomonas sp. BGYR3]MDG5489090.1 hypothetical protein [Sphingomonas sp. BGYR3]
MRLAASLAPLLVLPLVTGCIVKTAADIVTAPVRAGAQVVDWTTTSQDEADRNYGREMRKREAREGKERRAWEKACRKRPDECRPYDGYVASRPD